MYNYNFLCTYKFHEHDDQEDMYRIQLLQALNLDAWDDEKVGVVMEKLYNHVKSHEDIQKIIEKAKTSNQLKWMIHISGNDNYTIFTMLFKFELFEMTHKCLCELNEKQKISYANSQQLIHLMAE